MEEEKKAWSDQLCQLQEDFQRMELEYNAKLQEKEAWHHEHLEMNQMMGQHAHLSNIEGRYNGEIKATKWPEVPGTIDDVPVHALPDWGSTVDAVSGMCGCKSE